MTEKYGILVEALTEEFKRKMQDLSSFIQKFGKEAEKETSVMPRIDTNDYESRIERVQDKLDGLKDVINGIKEGKIEGNADELQKEYDQLLIKLASLKKEQEDYNNELKEMGDDGKKSTSMLSSLFDKSIGKIKRFTFYLLGARSVFSLFMRYRSIYYQFNEEMQYQSELSQNAIALSLAPAFEFLGNMVTYASIGLAKFIELLTGVNVLSKVTTKGIRDYNKSLKETQTLASGIDEITNLSLPSGTGLASQYGALEEFQKKVEEVTKFFEENQWINRLAEGLKLVWNYTIEKIFPTIGTIFDKIIEIGTWIFNNIIKPVGAFLYGTYEFIKFMVKAIVDVISGDMDKFAQDLQEFKTSVQDIFYWFSPYSKEEEKRFDEYLEKIKEVANVGGEVKIELDQEEAEKFYKYLENSKKEVDEIKDKIDLTQEIDENGKTIYIFKNDTIEALDEIEEKEEKTFCDRQVNVEFKITGNTEKLEESINKSLKKYGVAEDKFGNIFYNNSYAKGLDYVPYDEYPAILHKGEAVVPAEYNPTIHSAGNEYTNSLLETLIVSVQDLANRPNVFEVDGNEFAKATYPLYRSEENRQNYNAKVSVR